MSCTRGRLSQVRTDDRPDQDISSDRIDDTYWRVQLTRLSDGTYLDTVITQEARDTIQLSSHMTRRLSFSRLSWWRKQTWKFWQRRCISCRRWYKTGIAKILSPRRLQYYKNLKDEFAGQWKATYDVFGPSCRDKTFRDDREDGKIYVIPWRNETESEHKARRTCRKSGRQCFSRQPRNNMIEYPFSMQDRVYIFFLAALVQTILPRPFTTTIQLIHHVLVIMGRSSHVVSVTRSNLGHIYKDERPFFLRGMTWDHGIWICITHQRDIHSEELWFRSPYVNWSDNCKIRFVIPSTRTRRKVLDTIIAKRNHFPSKHAK